MSYHCTGEPTVAYVLAFRNKGWDRPLFETEGVKISNPRADSGVLGIYRSEELAGRIGTEWLRQQKISRDGFCGDFESNKSNGESGPSANNQRFWATIYKGRKSLKVVVEMRRILLRVPEHPRDEEDGENQDQDQDRDNEDDQDKANKEDDDKKDKQGKAKMEDEDGDAEMDDMDKEEPPIRHEEEGRQAAGEFKQPQHGQAG